MANEGIAEGNERHAFSLALFLPKATQDGCLKKGAWTLLINGQECPFSVEPTEIETNRFLEQVTTSGIAFLTGPRECLIVGVGSKFQYARISEMGRVSERGRVLWFVVGFKNRISDP